MILHLDARTGGPSMKPVRIGFLGAGGRGQSLLNDLLQVDGAQVTCIFDPWAPHAESARKRVTDAARPEPMIYTDAEGWKRLCDRDDVDFVINASPWEAHVTTSLYAMSAGKHVGLEVPAATTIEGCWALVEASQKYGRHCTLLENCCYDRSEMMVLNMVRDGLFGELTHAECGYIHELRSIFFDDDQRRSWRVESHANVNCNHYPTHGLGPVAQYLDINRGDQFDYLVGMGSPALGISEYAAEKFGRHDPRATRRYATGNMHSSLIKTKKGRSILLQYDVQTPRPYSRINRICGVKGMFVGFPDRITFGEELEDIETYRQQYEHPLWKRLGEFASKNGGHGGMDWIMLTRIIECLRDNIPPDIDVYDAASWSCIVEVSAKSTALNSQPVAIPDFTRGAWQMRLSPHFKSCDA